MGRKLKWLNVDALTDEQLAEIAKFVKMTPDEVKTFLLSYAKTQQPVKSE